jgi:hypothetical protein
MGDLLHEEFCNAAFVFIGPNSIEHPNRLVMIEQINQSDGNQVT